MRGSFIIAAICAATLAGCSSAKPPQFEILVSTVPPDASCVLTRAGEPIATADPTPAIALIDTAAIEVIVQCRRSGFADATAVLPPSTGPGWGYAVSGRSAADYRRSVSLVLTPLAELPR